MSTGSQDGGPEANSMGNAKAIPDNLACNGCRKAKLRCSRDRPSCQHCRKTGLECVYETKRIKPGLKAGAVENLHRRLDNLESLLKVQNQQDQVTIANNTNSRETVALDILALLAKELPKLVNVPAAAIEQPLSTPASSERSEGRCKRRRIDNEDIETKSSRSTFDESPQLPDPELLEAIISAYFCHIHPWIPMIHQGRFRQRLEDPAERTKLDVVLHSIIIAASKFVQDSNINTDVVLRTRRWVVWTAMDRLSLESLQALIILAFTDIGNGNAAKAWSIIGSLTRTVEYSQLTQEHEDSDHHTFCQPYSSLDYTQDWVEIEERRRIFWNVFLLDRYCSVTMSWNTSLTSDDVYRRLPCDGHLWRKRQPVVTPYFGIWDKSAGRIGNPIAFLPPYPSPGQSATELDLPNQPDTASSVGITQANLTDMSAVGAFGYNVEATESMSRVMSYFLQQKVNICDQREISSWLTRFKELDLRLVHWKMLLPQKWKTNPNLVREVALMDPNLTAAHVTHNASMILLHQLIAYPPLSWAFRNRLPSSCSADACYTAGVEIATITENYLNNSQAASPLSSQYAFCVFIAARMLLIHWRYSSDNQPPQEFWSLTHSLEEMSRRWVGFSEPPIREQDVSMKYATRLRELYGICSRDDSFRINVMDYTNEIDHHFYNRTFRSISNPQWPSETSVLSQAVPGLDIPMPKNLDSTDFNTIPQMMLDQHFMNMDRVIAFDDGSMFALDPGQW